MKSKPKVREISCSLSRKLAYCPKCGTASKRHSNIVRRIKDIDHKLLVVTISKHRCRPCNKIFCIGSDEIAPKGSLYSNRVHRQALDLYETGLTADQVGLEIKQRYGLEVPQGTIFEWLTKAGMNRGWKKEKPTSPEKSS